MAYTDLFNTGLDNLITSLGEITGLRVTLDPRNINPPCAFVDAPTFTAFNYNIAEMSVPVRIIGVGPGNLDTLRPVLANCAALLNKNVAVTKGNPTGFTIGGQEFSGYDLTIEMKVQTA